MDDQGQETGGGGVYLVTTEKSQLDVDRIHQLLGSSYWARNIPRATVVRSIENSMAFAVIGPHGLAGFARVITDYATFGYLADVIVDPGERGKGLGKLLVETIMSHPHLQGLRRWILVTGDAHELYRKYGFAEVRAPERFMERVVANPYGS